LADRDSIAIIIVTFNSVDEIDACLDSLVGHTSPFPTTITVVDNASADGTAQHVRERWPTVQVIDSGGNLGFARANNIGIRATASEYVLLMNPDTVAPPGAIQTLVRGLAAHP
jgi:N-acetylglucosaminyl-diphospho-decaprenol L-rhamnosyltransferase